MLAWNAAAVTGAKFDRNELTIWLDRVALREACMALKSHPQLQYTAISELPASTGILASRALRSSTTCFRFPRKNICG